MIKIQPSGDYVQLIYVDPVGESVQQELKSDTDAFECSYDSEGKLFMQFGAMRFENPDPTDFTIDGSAVTDAADFITKLNALFTGGSSGSSFLPTTGTGTATGDITGDLNGHDISFISPSADPDNPYRLWYVNQDSHENVLTISDGTSQATNSIFAGDQGIGLIINAQDGNSGNLVGFTGDATAQTLSATAGNTDAAFVQILLDNSSSSITYIAGVHTFNGVINLPTQAAPSAPNDGDIWREDNTNTGLKIRINGVTKTIVVA